MGASVPPCLLVTLGDVAGIGPEVAVRAWSDPALHELAALTMIGDVGVLQREAQRWNPSVQVVEVNRPGHLAGGVRLMPVVQGTRELLFDVKPSQVSRQAGKASYDFLVRAVECIRGGVADGMVTLPLHKEGLKAAGLAFPGHTEILAELTGTNRFGMMLYHGGLGVTHVTLHMALREVFSHLKMEAILEKIELTAKMLARLKKEVLEGRRPRLALCALNPHAGEGGLFGREEIEILEPAVRLAQERGYDVSGPMPSDTVFLHAKVGRFDGVIALYHDQGHIPMKLLAGYRAVNITLGLPIVRTSVAHGTAYDIVGKGVADPGGLIEAVRAAARLCG
ncbi:MAG: 4-hydroxythreonine-4-phosphate dehydrogenase PdxA [Gemmatales bacterium]|nr:4-hydroxythreonine-4-phosphate dehydrogenase PdxA [Gemmatales bacterium]MDW8385526.1 4-hydroxythreonine-4-phosphate dehydrogenase PdxA [Gemmatales bacterium]